MFLEVHLYNQTETFYVKNQMHIMRQFV